jgi:cardiolipin synthase
MKLVGRNYRSPIKKLPPGWSVLLLGWLIFSLTGCVIVPKQITKPIESVQAVSEPAFRETMGEVLQTPFVGGNRIAALLNGDQIFPAMLQAIAQAQATITLENWSWGSGYLSDRFIEALSERARAGVKVHVILDALGGVPLRKADRERMLRAGVEWVDYNSLWNLCRIYHRTHRKLLIVDGKIGFTGGICISDDWLGDAHSPRHWRDNQYQIEGPLVAQMQHVFMENWYESRKVYLTGDGYFPRLAPAGPSWAQCYITGPKDRNQGARAVFLHTIASARKSIRLAHSYFLPDKLMIQELLAARRRGVQIEIITPGIIDWNVVRRASHTRFGELLRAGIQFYEYQPALYHCKVMIVDDIWVTFGSGNFDDRSFYINDEANINVWDPDFARQQVTWFEADKAHSHRVLWEEFRRRPIWIRFLEQFAGLFRSQL